MIQSKPKPKKIYKAQVHILHSMVHMAKNKLKYEKWMQPRDFVEANIWAFEKMEASMKQNYGLFYDPVYSWEAAELFFKGLNDGDI
ncbi:hypothetical protein SAMN04487995_0331 [Dyadobacter koreensis]|uniref:Uncharacterized protein n=1 Tax=Dyadobacter koreensis TaxID=408657 RepID=A0A1H6QE38_9BACT|nr:hypothetical protein [Dyadobacter koreensis]SEI39204.1 hypothetical protein SAMN04487995_0331 [Dyadobacter koreensis]